MKGDSVRGTICHTQNDYVYYEWIKRELKTRPIYECRCDERLKTESEESTIYMTHIHWVPRGTGTPKDRDEVNRRDV